MPAVRERAAVPMAAGLVSVYALPSSAQARNPPSVLVFDQSLADASVDVHYAYSPDKGYVAVYGSDAAGKPVRKALSFAEISVGDHRNIKVKIDAARKQGEKLWVSIYRDADNKPGLDPTADTPVWAGELPSENAFVAK